MNRDFDEKFSTFDQDQHRYNIERRINERNIMFNRSSNDKQKPSFNLFQDDGYTLQVGEITGEQLDQSQLDQGMPLRPTIRTTTDRYRIEEIEPQESTTNPYLDFKLFHQKPNNKKISYYDPNQIQSSLHVGFSDIQHDHKILPESFHKTYPQNSQTFSQINNKFTLIFLQQFINNLPQKKELILSPFSILQVFCSLYLGSKNKTEADLGRYFSFPSKQITFNLINQINSQLSQTNTFSKMNLICVPQQVTINQGFSNSISKFAILNKYQQGNGVREAVKYNTMIKQMTNGMIKDIITPNMFNGNDNVLLINVIYFYSQWKHQFDKVMTKSDIFRGLNQKQVYMMCQNNKKHKYFEDSENQILEMDYKDESFAMGIVLPKGSHLPLISYEQFQYYIQYLKEEEINTIKIPKFNHESRYDVKKLFDKYGLKESMQHLDISEIIVPDKKYNYYVSSIMHIAKIIVNEEGTEASAATAMCTMNYCMPTKTKEINFIANHPFLYYIRHNPSNTLLFIGQYL